MSADQILKLKEPLGKDDFDSALYDEMLGVDWNFRYKLNNEAKNNAKLQEYLDELNERIEIVYMDK